MVTLENNLPSTTTNMTRQSTSAEGNSIDKDQTPPSRQEDLLSLQATTAPITLLFPPPSSGTCMHTTPLSRAGLFAFWQIVVIYEIDTQKIPSIRTRRNPSN